MAVRFRSQLLSQKGRNQSYIEIVDKTWGGGTPSSILLRGDEPYVLNVSGDIQAGVRPTSITLNIGKSTLSEGKHIVDLIKGTPESRWKVIVKEVNGIPDFYDGDSDVADTVKYEGYLKPDTSTKIERELNNACTLSGNDLSILKDTGFSTDGSFDYEKAYGVVSNFDDETPIASIVGMALDKLDIHNNTLFLSTNWRPHGSGWTATDDPFAYITLNRALFHDNRQKATASCFDVLDYIAKKFAAFISWTPEGYQLVQFENLEAGDYSRWEYTTNSSGVTFVSHHEAANNITIIDDDNITRLFTSDVGFDSPIGSVLHTYDFKEAPYLNANSTFTVWDENVNTPAWTRGPSEADTGVHWNFFDRKSLDLDYGWDEDIALYSDPIEVAGGSNSFAKIYVEYHLSAIDENNTWNIGATLDTTEYGKLYLTERRLFLGEDVAGPDQELEIALADQNNEMVLGHHVDDDPDTILLPEDAIIYYPWANIILRRPLRLGDDSILADVEARELVEGELALHGYAEAEETDPLIKSSHRGIFGVWIDYPDAKGLTLYGAAGRLDRQYYVPLQNNDGTPLSGDFSLRIHSPKAHIFIPRTAGAQVRTLLATRIGSKDSDEAKYGTRAVHKDAWSNEDFEVDAIPFGDGPSSSSIHALRVVPGRDYQGLNLTHSWVKGVPSVSNYSSVSIEHLLTGFWLKWKSLATEQVQYTIVTTDGTVITPQTVLSDEEGLLFPTDLRMNIAAGRYEGTFIRLKFNDITTEYESDKGSAAAGSASSSSLGGATLSFGSAVQNIQSANRLAKTSESLSDTLPTDDTGNYVPVYSVLSDKLDAGDTLVIYDRRTLKPQILTVALPPQLEDTKVYVRESDIEISISTNSNVTRHTGELPSVTVTKDVLRTFFSGSSIAVLSEDHISSQYDAEGNKTGDVAQDVLNVASLTYDLKHEQQIDVMDDNTLQTVTLTVNAPGDAEADIDPGVPSGSTTIPIQPEIFDAVDGSTVNLNQTTLWTQILQNQTGVYITAVEDDNGDTILTSNFEVTGGSILLDSSLVDIQSVMQFNDVIHSSNIDPSIYTDSNPTGVPGWYIRHSGGGYFGDDVVFDGNTIVNPTIEGDNVTIQGNLTVQGETTILQSTVVQVGDNIITLNDNIEDTEAPTLNAGLEIKRGTESTAVIQWNETDDWWEVGTAGSMEQILTGSSEYLDNTYLRLDGGNTMEGDLNMGANQILDASKLAVGTDTVPDWAVMALSSPDSTKIAIDTTAETGSAQADFTMRLLGVGHYWSLKGQQNSATSSRSMFRYTEAGYWYDLFQIHSDNLNFEIFPQKEVGSPLDFGQLLVNGDISVSGDNRIGIGTTSPETWTRLTAIDTSYARMLLRTTSTGTAEGGLSIHHQHLQHYWRFFSQKWSDHSKMILRGRPEDGNWYNYMEIDSTNRNIEWFASKDVNSTWEFGDFIINGDVGIDVASPSYNLDVAETARIQGDLKVGTPGVPTVISLGEELSETIVFDDSNSANKANYWENRNTLTINDYQPGGQWTYIGPDVVLRTGYVHVTKNSYFDGIVGFASDIGTDDYISQTTGWQIDTDAHADFRSIYADELIVQAFTSEISQALAGEDFLTKSVAILASSLTINGTGTYTLHVEDLPGHPGVRVFTAGDTIRLRYISREGGGLVVQDIWGTVSSYVDKADNTQEWDLNVVDVGATPSGATLHKGSIALDYGTPGDGIIERTVLDSAGAPYTQMKTWNGTTVPTSYDVNLRMGNLNGLTGYTTDAYGLMVGDSTASRLLADDTFGIRLQYNNEDRIALEPDGSGFIGVGTARIEWDVNGAVTLGSLVTITWDDFNEEDMPDYIASSDELSTVEGQIPTVITDLDNDANFIDETTLSATLVGSPVIIAGVYTGSDTSPTLETGVGLDSTGLYLKNSGNTNVHFDDDGSGYIGRSSTNSISWDVFGQVSLGSNVTLSWDQVTGTGDVATTSDVFSGDYSDLDNKPDIPVVPEYVTSGGITSTTITSATIESPTIAGNNAYINTTLYAGGVQIGRDVGESGRDGIYLEDLNYWRHIAGTSDYEFGIGKSGHSITFHTNTGLKIDTPDLKVNSDGVYVEGEVHSTSGQIGTGTYFWTIDSNKIYSQGGSGSTTSNDTLNLLAGGGIYHHNAVDDVDGEHFGWILRPDSTGHLAYGNIEWDAAGNLTVAGDIIAGSVAGWSIDDNVIEKGDASDGYLGIAVDNTYLGQAWDTSGRLGVPGIGMFHGSSPSDRIFVNVGETYGKESGGGWTGRYGFSVTYGKYGEALFEASVDSNGNLHTSMKDINITGDLTIDDGQILANYDSTDNRYLVRLDDAGLKMYPGASGSNEGRVRWYGDVGDGNEQVVMSMYVRNGEPYMTIANKFNSQWGTFEHNRLYIGADVQLGAGDNSSGADLFCKSTFTNSDIRLKENITTLDSALDKVRQLRGVSFDWKDMDRNRSSIGFIAQEVEKVLPELVSTNGDGYKSLSYGQLTALLIEAVKELDDKLDQ